MMPLPVYFSTTPQAIERRAKQARAGKRWQVVLDGRVLAVFRYREDAVGFAAAAEPTPGSAMILEAK